LLFASIHFIWGFPSHAWADIWRSLYFSAVSFTAIGYGGWVTGADAPSTWTKWFGVTESFIGVFLIALFLVTFTRRWTR
jgi:hypothetical protein